MQNGKKILQEIRFDIDLQVLKIHDDKNDYINSRKPLGYGQEYVKAKNEKNNFYLFI